MKREIKHIFCALSFFIWSNNFSRCSFKPKNFLQDSIYTIFDFNYNIFSRDTLQALTAFMPLYFSTRMIDERVQSFFYCPRHHKNLHQMSDWCFKVSDKGVPAILISLMSLALLPVPDHLRETAYVYALTLPLTWLGKKLLKELRTDANIRPHNEHFERHKKFWGGCPSGHMMEAVYATVVFGVQEGPLFAIPLTIFSAFLFANFVSCNRHFVSQLVAGAGLGVIYGLATNKTLAKRRIQGQDWSVNFYTDKYGNPYVNVSCEF